MGNTSRMRGNRWTVSVAVAALAASAMASAATAEHTLLAGEAFARSTGLTQSVARPVASRLAVDPNYVRPRRVPAGQRFSRPVFLPFRGEARVGCVVDNCTENGRPKHGYWAVDFSLDGRGSSVYAAGHGRVTIERPQPMCNGGRLWIDHGGGITSRYVHFTEISVRNGQWVGPHTELGTVGSSTCARRTLHFAVSNTGPFPVADGVDPGQLRACSAGQRLTYPHAAGLSSWNSFVQHETTVSNDSVTCWTASPAVSPPRALQLRSVNKPRGSGLVARWRPPISGFQPSRYRIGWRHVGGGGTKWSKMRFKQVTGGRNRVFIPTQIYRTRYQVSIVAIRGEAVSRWVVSSLTVRGTAADRRWR